MGGVFRGGWGQVFGSMMPHGELNSRPAIKGQIMGHYYPHCDYDDCIFNELFPLFMMIEAKIFLLIGSDFYE